MERECIMEAATVAEAVDAALEELGVQQDAVGYEVLEEPGRKMFGIGGDRVAKVRVWVKAEYLAELEQAKKAAQAALQPEEATELGAPVMIQDEARANNRAAEQPELSDEDLDKVADTAVDVLQTILASFGIEGSAIEEYEGDEGEIILDVVGGDLAVLIGRHGRTLDALHPQSRTASLVFAIRSSWTSKAIGIGAGRSSRTSLGALPTALFVSTAQ